MTATEPILGPAPHTAEWLAEHRRILTATDMAAVLGFSEYAQALDVYRVKKGIVEPFAGNEHTRRGQRYEPVILADYAEAQDCELMSPMPLYYHPKLDYLGATPDAEARSPDRTMPPWGVEAKWSMSRSIADQLGEEGTDWIPEMWMVQIQTQMAVMGWQRVDVAALVYGRLRVFRCPRNNDLIQSIEDAAKEMWERIANDDPPEPNWQHPGTPALVKALYHGGTGVTVDLSEEAAELWARKAAVAKVETSAKAEKERLDAEFRAAMKDADVGRLPNGREVYRIACAAKHIEYDAKPYDYFRERKGT